MQKKEYIADKTVTDNAIKSGKPITFEEELIDTVKYKNNRIR